MIAAGAALAYPDATDRWVNALDFKLRHWWLDRRIERLARKVYRQLQKERREMGLEPLPPFSWKALGDRYGER